MRTAIRESILFFFLIFLAAATHAQQPGYKYFKLEKDNKAVDRSDGDDDEAPPAETKDRGAADADAKTGTPTAATPAPAQTSV